MRKAVKVGPILARSVPARVEAGTGPRSGCPESLRSIARTGCPAFSSNRSGVWQSSQPATRTR